MRRRTLIVMVKEPRPGRVKTRLGRDIGMVDAAWWYRQQCVRLLRNLRDRRWDVILSVAPDRATDSAWWPTDLPRIPQGTGNIGARMARAFASTYGPTVLIGSDIPGVTPAHIAKAFGALGQAKTVIGPAPDGGFWLIGLSHPSAQPKTLFKGVRWSHAETLTDTLPTLPEPVAFTAQLNDVDTAADL